MMQGSCLWPKDTSSDALFMSKVRDESSKDSYPKDYKSTLNTKLFMSN
jgi:hypothetical protein